MGQDLSARPLKAGRCLALVLTLGLLLRMVYLLEMRDNPFFDTPIIDAESYDRWARQILAGEFLWQETKLHGPLYPFFLALIYRVFGIHYLAVYLIQHLLGIISCLLVYRIASRLFGQAIGLLASLIASTYWILIYFEGQLLAESLATCLVLSSLCLLLAARESGRSFHWFSAGLLLALSVICRPHLLAFFPLVLLWAAWIYGPSKDNLRYLLRTLFSFTLAFFLPLSLVTGANYLVYHDFVLIQPNTGLNLYLGNNPEANGLPYATPGNRWQELASMAAREGKATPSQQDRYYLARTLEFIKGEPLAYLRLLLRKLLLFWNYYEIDASQDIGFFRGHSSLAGLLFFDFRLVSPLALLALLMLLREAFRHKGLALLYLFVVSCCLSLVMTVVSARYRLPAIPVLIVFAARGMSLIWERIRDKGYRAGWPPLVLLTLLVLLTDIDHFDLRHTRIVRTEYNLGSVYNKKGQYEKALLLLREAARKEPAESSTHLQLGIAYAGLDRWPEASQEFRMAVKTASYYLDKALALRYLGKVYCRMKEWDKALAAFQAALSLQPGDPVLRRWWERVRRRRGRSGKE